MARPDPIEITQTRGMSAVANYSHDGRVQMRAENEAGLQVLVWLTPGQATTLAGHLALAAGDALRATVR